MTNNLKTYLDYIFKNFKGMKIGQGGFFTRTWNNDRNTDREFKTHAFDVLNCLVQNKLLLADNYQTHMPFIKLGEKGFEYMQGGDLELGNLSLAELIDLSSPDQIYNRVWDFIGNADTAPFYLKGPEFFRVIAPYVGLSSFTYSQYTQSLVNEGKSTSRPYWYRELFGKLKPQEIESFLNDLSRKIIDIYQPLYRAPAEPDDDLFAVLDTVTPMTDHPTTPTTDSALPSVGTDKKVIFITYTWETAITPGHKAWVKALAERLVSDGFDVRLDQFQPLGTEMNHFMANSVKQADRILLICTPTFKNRQDEVEKASGFEASLISNDLIKDIKSTKFVPIIRIGEPEECMPAYLGNRNGLIWRSVDNAEQKYSELLSDLKNN